MSTSTSDAGKHRGTTATSHRSLTDRRYTGTHATTRRSAYLFRRPVMSAAVAATATAVLVAGGVITGDDGANSSTLAASIAGDTSLSAASTQQSLTERRETVSRSDARAPLDSDAQNDSAGNRADGGSADTASADSANEQDNSDPRAIARALMPEYGFSADQFGCLDALYVSESNWDMHADNPTSSAYGIPQALTETHDMPAGYFTSAEVQIRWGLNYIRDSYGTPCSAWSFKQGNNWY